MFSKSKPRHPLSICADCGSTSPSWASVNRGVLICSDCCSVHRSLGRHISHVKCLKHGTWIPEQLTMVQSLYSCGANSIWEYSLLNPSSSKSGKRKPQPGDPVHPTKSDFIRAKHQLLSYVFKPAKDDVQITESDLSKQLHSSVRTPNLETSLRLLSQGADPNYFHPEKNSTPLSVAAKAGQVSQVELLLVYGADPAAVDLSSKTAGDHARASGFLGLATRIQNAQYELSDRLSFFLCGRRPDHFNNKHYLIPEQGGHQAEPAKVARRKMTGLSNKVFEELAVDVYDEVDRRETDALWNKIESSSQASVLVPFLPVNPDYSATRNQGRQKLARLTAQEFSALVVDVLKEVRRRQLEIDSARGISTTAVKYSPSHELNQTLTKLNLSNSTGCRASALSDDEPLYDSVASDDDYYIISEKDELVTRQQARLREQQLVNNRGTSQMIEPASRSGSACSASTTLQRSKSLAAADRDAQSTEFTALKEQLESSEKKVQALIASNDDMRTELAKLQSTVQRLVHDNKELQRASMSPSHTSHDSPQHTGPAHTLLRDGAAFTDGRSGSPLASHGSPLRSPQSPGSRSHSMYEYREGRSANQSGPTSLPGPGTSYMSVGNTGSPRNYPANRRDSYDQPGGGSSYPVNRFTNSGYTDSGTHSLPYSFQNSYGDATVYQEVLPSQEEVVRRTEAITRCIQELLISAKDEKFDSFIPCSERIVRAVTDMVLLFPEEPGHSAVSASLSSLTAAATHFETECRMLILRSQREPLNQNFVTQQVIQCAFDIAKATKQLVALFQ